jgi:pyridoxamine 5'-phosphate oxidase
MTNSDKYQFNKGKLESFKYEDPMLFFNEWYQDAQENKCAEPHAMTLSTVSSKGQPSGRIVYMRELMAEGIGVYTNYLSRKGEDILKNPNVSALFYWDCLERQVRIEGVAEKMQGQLSDDYFAQRPRISQIGAWASEQSSEILDRKSLEERAKFFEKKYPKVVPRPPHWGGFLIRPVYFEFWQGRLGRLHDRLCYTKNGSDWQQARIAP